MILHNFFFLRRRTRDLGGQRVERESAVFPYGQEGWQHSGFIKKSVARSSRQVITPLLCTGKTISAGLCPVLSPPPQGRHGHTWSKFSNRHQDSQGAGAYGVHGQIKKASLFIL